MFNKINWNTFARWEAIDMVLYGYPISDCVEFCLKHSISFKLNANGMTII